jgi:hypothetical protein
MSILNVYAGRLVGVLGPATALAMSALACSHVTNDCDIMSRCPSTDAGNVGGNANGGNGAGGNATGGVTSVCNPICSGTKPVCNAPTKTCVECSGDSNCSASKPACNTTNNTCVQCVKDANCPGSTPFCDTTQNICIQCRTSADCTSASASLCSSGSCGPCAHDADCSNITDKSVCKTTSTGDAGVDTGTCVQCSVANETHCNGNSCDPATNACTTTSIASLDPCNTCKADSECKGGNLATPTTRCVPMTFGSAGLAHGNYCLQRFAAVSSTGCKQPYILMPGTLGSTSGASAESYCGINESITTCEALLDLASGTITCSVDSDCGKGKGGLCKTVGGTPSRCTIPCGSGAECLASPSPGNACAFDSTSTYKYCQ